MISVASPFFACQRSPQFGRSTDKPRDEITVPMGADAIKPPAGPQEVNEALLHWSNNVRDVTIDHVSPSKKQQSARR